MCGQEDRMTALQSPSLEAEPSTITAQPSSVASLETFVEGILMGRQMQSIHTSTEVKTSRLWARFNKTRL